MSNEVLAALLSVAMRSAGGLQNYAPRVLTVDNYEPALERLAEALRCGGYLVKNVHSAHEAVLAAPSFLPDLMVADVELPSMDGLAAALEVKRWDPRCEVLLFSESAMTVGKTCAVQAGGFSFSIVRTPVDGSEFIQQVEGILSVRYRSQWAC